MHVADIPAQFLTCVFFSLFSCSTFYDNTVDDIGLVIILMLQKKTPRVFNLGEIIIFHISINDDKNLNYPRCNIALQLTRRFDGT